MTGMGVQASFYRRAPSPTIEGRNAEHEEDKEMTGSIDKYITKGSSKPHWRYRIYTGKDSAGVKQYATRAGFEKQALAGDAMRDRINELRRLRNQPASAEEIPLASWLTRWIDTYAVHTCQPKTLERYGQLARYITRRVSSILRHPA